MVQYVFGLHGRPVSISFFDTTRTGINYKLESAGPGVYPLRLNGGPDGIQAFFVELAFSPVSQPDCQPSPGWPGVFTCTVDDPPGLIRLAGATDNTTVTGIFEFAVLIFSSGLTQLVNAEIYARVETIGPDHHVTLVSTAARFGGLPLSLPVIPASPLVDLSTAYHSHGDEALAACMVLVRRLRVIESTMFYATDTELTLMVRMTDRGGVPDSNLTRVWLYLSPCQAPEWAGIARVWQVPLDQEKMYFQAQPHDEDGWYGVSYRGQLPAQPLYLSLMQSTLSPVGSTNDTNRSRIHGFIPFNPVTFGSTTGQAYATLQLGQAQPTCPWDARAPAEIVLTWTIRALGNASYPQLQAATGIMACNLSVPARRIQLSLDSAGTLTISVGVESFLRAHDVGLAVPDKPSLQEWFQQAGLNLTLTGPVRALASHYERDPADPDTACPKGFYYSDAGFFRPVPDHASTDRACYGFQCDPGYTLDPDTPVPVCIPSYVQDWIFWTVITLVCTLGLAVVLISCALRILFARVNAQPQSTTPEPEPEPVDNMLPIGATAAGELVFEAIIESASDTSSDSSDSSDSD